MSARDDYPRMAHLFKTLAPVSRSAVALDVKAEIERAFDEIDRLRTEIAAANYKLDRVVRRVLG